MHNLWEVVQETTTSCHVTWSVSLYYICHLKTTCNVALLPCFSSKASSQVSLCFCTMSFPTSFLLFYCVQLIFSSLISLHFSWATPLLFSKYMFVCFFICRFFLSFFALGHISHFFSLVWIFLCAVISYNPVHHLAITTCGGWLGQKHAYLLWPFPIHSEIFLVPHFRKLF